MPELMMPEQVEEAARLLADIRATYADIKLLEGRIAVAYDRLGQMETRLEELGVEPNTPWHKPKTLEEMIDAITSEQRRCVVAYIASLLEKEVGGE